MAARVAVAGGTGVVGRHVVAALAARGDEPVPLSRSAGIDILSGAGLVERLRGVDAVVDVLNITTTRAKAAREFFTRTTNNLAAAMRDAGVGRYVVLSIVGVDRVKLGYYAGKQLQERLALESGLATTVIRATQFHEFAGQLLDRVPGPVAVVPRMRIRPVAAREVGAHLAGLVDSGEHGYAPEFAGPREEELVDLARKTLRAQGRRRAVVPVQMPGPAGRAMASGALIPDGPGPRGTVTFDDWLAAAVPE